MDDFSPISGLPVKKEWLFSFFKIVIL